MSEPTLRDASVAVAVLLAAVAVLLGVAFVLAGCSSAKKPESLADRATIFGFPLSDYQRNVLADGDVTDAEYRAAVEADRSCVISKGVHASPIVRRPDGVHWGFGVGGCDPGQDCAAIRDAAAAAYDTCGFEYVYAIEAKVTNQSIPTGAEAEREFAKVAACLDKAGVTGVKRSDREEDIVQRIERTLPDMNSLERGAAEGCLEATFLYWEPFKEDG